MKHVKPFPHIATAKTVLSTASIAVLLSFSAHASAQSLPMSGASQTVTTPVPHTDVPFRIEDTGTKLPDIVWGLDQAWISEGNMRRGLNFAGQEMIKIVRLSFQPSHSVEGGQLSDAQKNALDERIRIAKFARFAKINLNSDPQDGKAVNSWYKTSNANTNGPRWAQLIGLTKQYVEAKGLKVVSISPFNEPDYTDWNQGTQATFKAICKAIREDHQFDGILLCGGNTLSPEYAPSWYNYSKEYLDEGNTHQLAGSFDQFANFYTLVKNDGKVGVGDELHNTMEAMVASNYGMTKGIWWGTCDHTRSQFMKASLGTRIGYAENRGRWTAAGVYRHADSYREGCPVQGFVGTSERQAAATTFRFIALDHDVFYNGQGPMREFIMRTPGWPNGAGYDSPSEAHCKNSEGLVNIQGGEDIMPELPTKPTLYRIVNAYSGKSLSTENNSNTSGAAMWQQTNSLRNQAQQWLITPDDPLKYPDDLGSYAGDFSYFTIANAKNTNFYPDVRDWSLEEGGQVILFQGGLGDNEKWFFEYAGDGNFYIRSKHSALYLQVCDGNEIQQKNARQLCQGAFTGELIQQWKLINIDDGDIAFNARVLAVPTGLRATPQTASILLEWDGPTVRTLKDFIVQRSTDQVNWNTIHNHVTGMAYVDNTVEPGQTYYYRVKSVSVSELRSEACEAVSATATGKASCIMRIACDSLWDSSHNGNHAALNGSPTMMAGKIGDALDLKQSNSNYLQLPATIANHKELTLSAWIYYRGGNQWQRIFDFGNDVDHYVFLTPNNSYTGKMRLGIKNGGTEETMDTNVPTTNKWTHVAVTFGTDKIVIYVNGKAAVTSTSIKTRPSDFRPVLNYIGRSQFSADPFFNGAIDDVRVYNYALSADEVAAIADLTDGVEQVENAEPASQNRAVFDLSGRRIPAASMRAGLLYIIDGRKVMMK